MEYIDKIFERANLQNIREFLLHEVNCEQDPGTFKERLEIAEKNILNKLKTYPDCNNRDELIDNVYYYANRLQDVYMEIGMQCGARLAAQLLLGK